MTKYPHEDLVDQIGKTLIDGGLVPQVSEFFGNKLATDTNMAVIFMANLICQIAGKPLEDSWQFQPMAEGIVSQIKRDHPHQ